MDGAPRTNSLKLFGSYSRRDVYSLNDYSLNDLIGSNGPYRYYLRIAPLGAGTAYPISPGLSTPIVEKLPKYWVWDAGMTWTVLHSRLQFDYNFERRNFSKTVVSDIGGGSYYFGLSTMTSAQHRLAVSYCIVDRTDISWLMGVNTTVIRVGDVMNPNPYIIGDNTPDNKKASFTGGWVNRIRFHGFSVGLDVLYHFSGELYADARGVSGGGILTADALSNHSKYYGVGANLGL